MLRVMILISLVLASEAANNTTTTAQSIMTTTTGVSSTVTTTALPVMTNTSQMKNTTSINTTGTTDTPVPPIYYTSSPEPDVCDVDVISRIFMKSDSVSSSDCDYLKNRRWITLVYFVVFILVWLSIIIYRYFKLGIGFSELFKTIHLVMLFVTLIGLISWEAAVFFWLVYFISMFSCKTEWTPPNIYSIRTSMNESSLYQKPKVTLTSIQPSDVPRRQRF